MLVARSLCRRPRGRRGEEAAASPSVLREEFIQWNWSKKPGLHASFGKDDIRSRGRVETEKWRIRREDARMERGRSESTHESVVHQQRNQQESIKALRRGREAEAAGQKIMCSETVHGTPSRCSPKPSPTMNSKQSENKAPTFRLQFLK